MYSLPLHIGLSLVAGGSDRPSMPFGAPFAMSVRAHETAADFCERLAARLGEVRRAKGRVDNPPP